MSKYGLREMIAEIRDACDVLSYDTLLIEQTQQQSRIADGFPTGHTKIARADDPDGDVDLTRTEAHALRRSEQTEAPEGVQAAFVATVIRDAAAALSRATVYARGLYVRREELRDREGSERVACVECDGLRSAGWPEDRPNGARGRCRPCYDKARLRDGPELKPFEDENLAVDLGA